MTNLNYRNFLERVPGKAFVTGLNWKLSRVAKHDLCRSLIVNGHHSRRYYLAALLREELAAPLDGIIKSVAVQQAGHGNRMDDGPVLLHTREQWRQSPSREPLNDTKKISQGA